MSYKSIISHSYNTATTSVDSTHPVEVEAPRTPGSLLLLLLRSGELVTAEQHEGTQKRLLIVNT